MIKCREFVGLVTAPDINLEHKSVNEIVIDDKGEANKDLSNQMKPCCLAVMSANFYCVEKPEKFSGLNFNGI